MTRSHADLRKADVLALCDTRERAPLDLPLRTVEAKLVVGDYSVFGLTNLVAVERKSIQDLAMSCGRERERFDRAIDRLENHPVGVVVIEGSESTVRLKQYRGQMDPNAILASVYSWIARGITVHWAGDRENAARVVANVLYYFARHRFEELAPLVGGLKLLTQESA